MELGPHGVHVLSVAPGPVNTGFAARAGLVMGSAATPLEIARGIVGALGPAERSGPACCRNCWATTSPWHPVF